MAPQNDRGRRGLLGKTKERISRRDERKGFSERQEEAPGMTKFGLTRGYDLKTTHKQTT
jgi:hypothetical protein